MSAKSFNIDGLLAWLEQSGTGKPKLDALKALASRVETFSDFTRLACDYVSSATIVKMEAYYAANPQPKPELPKPAKKEHRAVLEPAAS